MIKTVYFDLDGVLCDFDRRYFERYGELPGSMRDRKEFHKNWDDFVETRQFETLDLWPEAQKLFDAMADIDGYVKVEILTSSGGPKHHESVAAQKRLWLTRRSFPYKINVVPGRKHKAEYASAETVLIDDTYDVIQSFIAAGGHAIHHKSAVNTLSMLRAIIDREKAVK